VVSFTFACRICVFARLSIGEKTKETSTIKKNRNFEFFIFFLWFFKRRGQRREMKPASSAVAVVLCAVLLLQQLVDAFYIPGVAPRNYKYGEVVDLKVNKVTSVKAQLPFSYYSLPVCKPEKIVDVAENLGEVLSGDVIENSAYEIKMKVPQTCKVLCEKKYDNKDRALFREKIANKYTVHWIVDNLPAAMKVPLQNGQEYYEVGFPLGVDVTDPSDEKRRLYYLFNHVRIRLHVHQNSDLFEGYRVIRFEVEPFSVKHVKDSKGNLKTCSEKEPVKEDMGPQPIGASDGKTESERIEEVIWTYDVEFVDSDVAWASRWDVFFNRQPEDPIHWFSIVNSLMIVLFLTGMVAMILMRTLHRDIARYNAAAGAAAGGDLDAAGLVLVDPEEAQEETGWKMVHGDVFRPPTTSPMLLSVFAGTGVQIFSCCVILMFFAVAGFLSPANRGALLTMMLLLFVFCAAFAGFWSARLYKMMGGKLWGRNTLLTALLYPGFVFGVFFIVNLFVWSAGSSGAVPFLTMFILVIMWFGISVPLVSLSSVACEKSITWFITQKNQQQDWRNDRSAACHRKIRRSHTERLTTPTFS
jgi:transmembrane 9 superfamily protein 2/4